MDLVIEKILEFDSIYINAGPAPKRMGGISPLRWVPSVVVSIIETTFYVVLDKRLLN